MQKFGFAILLATLLLFRLLAFDYPLANAEAQRDFLVGKHILAYRELPLTGSCCLWNGAFGKIRNNPVYYYLIALILLLKRDILFLSLVNIVFQLLTIVFIYHLAKNLFSEKTALLATVLYGLSWEYAQHARFFWQPYAMEPFVYLSYTLLLFAFLKKRYLLLLLSTFFFFLAASLHNSVYGILPTFTLLTLLILRLLKQPKKSYLFVFLVAFVSFAIFYAPWFIHSFWQPGRATLFFNAAKPFLVSPAVFMSRLMENTSLLLKSFFLNLDVRGLLPIFLLSLFAYVRLCKRRKERIAMVILVGAILQFLVVSSLPQATVWSFYFLPIFGLLAILIAELITAVPSNSTPLRMAKVLLIILLVKVFSLNFQYVRNSRFANLASAHAVVGAMRETIEKENINQREFRMAVYPPMGESPPTSDLPFWVFLEEELNQKFVTIVDADNSYKLINKDAYIFVVCQSLSARIDVVRDCLTPFFAQQKTYTLIRRIYHQELFSVFLAKKVP